LSKVWFITGCSSGFGRSLVVKALEAGDQVVATARKPEQLADLEAQYPDMLRTMALDVTDPAQIKAVVAQAAQAFGRLDVVVNNAGYGLIGALEEGDEAQTRRCLETNLVGPLLVMQAALSVFRAQRGGHIINMSAIAALNNHPGFAVYGAAKAGLDSAGDALRDEARPLGIGVTNVVPGPFRTDFIGRSLERASGHLGDYDKTSGKFAAYLDKIDGAQPGDPDAAASAIAGMVRAGKTPARLFLGKFAMESARKKMAALERDIAEWEAVSLGTDY
jgi:NAD(P)-dependent dehydrogenase (short-subunit alcohol dehydrogenase family)